jgi:hypothetical protein
MDYTDFSSSPEGSKKKKENHKKWWTLEGAAVARAVKDDLNNLYSAQFTRINQLALWARYYGSRDLLNNFMLFVAPSNRMPSATNERLKFNVVQSAIDTITSKISKNKPRPFYETAGGDWSAQQRAKRMTRFMEGLFLEQKIKHLAPTAVRNSAIFGDGIIYEYIDATEKKMHWETVLPHEIWVDEVEAAYGFPRTLHRIKTIDRESLIELFPDFEEAIMHAPNAAILARHAVSSIADLVSVAESWHLGESVDVPGRRVITIENHLLEDQPYKLQRFPFVRFQWNPRPFGYWSQGAAEQLSPIQLELNKTFAGIQRAHDLCGKSLILCPAEAEVVESHFTNDIGTIISYVGGNKPEYVTPAALNSEVYQYAKMLIAQAYEQIGVSQLSAGSKKPDGLDSGKALREYNNIETERFMTIGEAYEDFHIDLASLSSDLFREYVGKNHYKIKIPGSLCGDILDWQDIKMDEQDYILNCYPVSSLPQDVSGRLQTVQEFMQSGLYSRRTAKKLLSLPDIDAVDSLESATDSYVHKMLDRIIEEGIGFVPEPYDDLNLIRELTLQYYARGKTSDLPEDKLQLLRDIIDAVQEMQDKAAMNAAAQNGGLAQPIAPPTPLTPSPMVPQQAPVDSSLQ